MIMQTIQIDFGKFILIIIIQMRLIRSPLTILNMLIDSLIMDFEITYETHFLQASTYTYYTKANILK